MADHLGPLGADRRPRAPAQARPLTLRKRAR
jgi:hypothetical protein